MPEITLPPVDPGVKVKIEVPEIDADGNALVNQDPKETRMFRLVPITLDVEQEAKKARQALQDMLGSGALTGDDEEADLEFAKAYTAELDVILKSTDGGKREPSTVLVEAYRERRLTWKQIKELTDAVITQARPT